MAGDGQALRPEFSLGALLLVLAGAAVVGNTIVGGLPDKLLALAGKGTAPSSGGIGSGGGTGVAGAGGAGNITAQPGAAPGTVIGPGTLGGGIGGPTQIYGGIGSIAQQALNPPNNLAGAVVDGTAVV